MDDSELRAHIRRCNSSHPAALDAGAAALAFSAVLYHRLVVVLGSQPADCGMDCAPTDGFPRTKSGMSFAAVSNQNSKAESDEFYLL
jgi:hypothetical protein